MLQLGRWIRPGQRFSNSLWQGLPGMPTSKNTPKLLGRCTQTYRMMLKWYGPGMLIFTSTSHVCFYRARQHNIHFNCGKYRFVLFNFTSTFTHHVQSGRTSCWRRHWFETCEAADARDIDQSKRPHRSRHSHSMMPSLSHRWSQIYGKIQQAKSIVTWSRLLGFVYIYI